MPNVTMLIDKIRSIADEYCESQMYFKTYTWRLVQRTKASVCSRYIGV